MLAEDGTEAADDDNGMEAMIDSSGREPDSNDATDDLKLPISHQVSLQGKLTRISQSRLHRGQVSWPGLGGPGISFALTEDCADERSAP